MKTALTTAALSLAITSLSSLPLMRMEPLTS